MQAGSTYRISSCGSTDIVDTRLTVYSNSGGASLGFNDDFCGTRAQLDFTPATTGNYRILLDKTGPGNTCVSTISSNECGEIVVTLISAGSGSEYCIPNYSSGTINGDFINSFTLGSISNPNTGSSSGASYNDYTNLSTQLSASTTYTISVQNNPDFAENIAAWIDYDQNLEFSETELLDQIQIVAGATGQITFTTPAVVVAGETVILVPLPIAVPPQLPLYHCQLVASLSEPELMLKLLLLPMQMLLLVAAIVGIEELMQVGVRLTSIKLPY
jgi:hypothetical protein